MMDELSKRLIEGGYTKDTPAAIVYKASWPDEKKFICTVGTLAETADANGIKNPQQITTDAMGNGMLQLNGLAAGEYSVNVTYRGNDNYSGSGLTQKITIKEVQKQTSSQSSIPSKFADAKWSRRYYWDDGTPVNGEVYLIVTKDGQLWTYDNGEYYPGPE